MDALARDGYAALTLLEGRTLSEPGHSAAALLVTVLGQDLQQREDGVFRIARRVAPDRVISTVDPEARHGHKTAARGFDGYKGHLAIDPDSEIITATEVTAGNVGDAVPAETLLCDVLDGYERPTSSDTAEPTEVYGDASYGTADFVEKIEAAGVEANIKVQAPSAQTGHFAKDAFDIDLDAQTVTCPAGVLVRIRKTPDGGGMASFAESCAVCLMRSRCTDAKEGRNVRIHPNSDPPPDPLADTALRPGRNGIEPRGPRSNASSHT